MFFIYYYLYFNMLPKKKGKKKESKNESVISIEKRFEKAFFSSSKIFK